MPGASFEAITGRLGVGAIAFLGCFLLVDGLQIGVFGFVEHYGKSATWGIVGVVPTAVVTYIVGVFCVGVSELLLSRWPLLASRPPDEIQAVSRDGAPLIQQAYAEQLRNHELLNGSFVAFLVLAVGCLVDAANMRGFDAIVWLATSGAVLLAALSLVFSRRAAARASEIAAAVAGAARQGVAADH